MITKNHEEADKLYKDAMRYMSTNNTKMVKENLERAAEMNHIRSITMLGKLYRDGILQADQDNNDIAIEWFKKAIEIEPNGEAADEYLKLMNEKRNRVSDDSIPDDIRQMLDDSLCILAQELSQKATWPDWVDVSLCDEIADYYLGIEENEKALYWLGKAYERCQGYAVPYLIKMSNAVEDEDIGRKLRIFQELRRIAENSNEDAIRLCGDCYRIGYGVPQSDAIALLWYRKMKSRAMADYFSDIRLFDNFVWKKDVESYYEACGINIEKNRAYRSLNTGVSKSTYCNGHLYFLKNGDLIRMSETEGFQVCASQVGDVQIYTDNETIYITDFIYNENKYVTKISEYKENGLGQSNYVIEGKGIILDSYERELLLLQAEAQDQGSQLVVYNISDNQTDVICNGLVNVAKINERFVYYCNDNIWKLYERATKKSISLSKVLGLSEPLGMIDIDWIDTCTNTIWVNKSCPRIEKRRLLETGILENITHYLEARMVESYSVDHLMGLFNRYQSVYAEDRVQFYCNGYEAISVFPNKIIWSNIWGDAKELEINFSIEEPTQFVMGKKCFFIINASADPVCISKYDLTEDGGMSICWSKEKLSSYE